MAATCSSNSSNCNCSSYKKIDEYAMQQRQPQQKTRTILNPNSMQNKPSDKEGMH